MCLPACAVVKVSRDAVAPDIGTPFAYHWYEKTVPGVHVPVRAVSTDPICGVPPTDGSAVTAMRGVFDDVRETVDQPDLRPVTVTVICWSRW